MATKQDAFGDATLIGSQTGSEVEGGLLINKDMGTAYLNFNGTDQYAERTETDFRSGDSSGSVSAWIYIKGDGGGAGNEIFTSSAGDVSTHYFLFNAVESGTTNTDQFRIQTRSNAGTANWVQTTKAFPRNQWRHVVLTSSGTAWKIHVDGVSEALTVTAGSNTGDWFADLVTNTRDNVSIGRWSSGRYFNGIIAEVSVYSQTLSDSEVSSLYSTATQPYTPVAHWAIDEGSGTNLDDSGSDNSHDLTTSGTPTWVSQPLYAIRSQTTSTELLSGLGSTAVSNFKYTTSKKPGGSEARLQFSSDNSTWKNANGDLVSNGGGYLFDGVDDVITVAQTVDTLMSNALGTMACWVRPDGAGVSDANGYLTDGIIADSSAFVGIHWGTRTGGGTGFHFYNWDGSPGDYVDYAVPATDYGKWFHLVWKHEGGTLYAYVNGVLVGSVASGNTVTVTGTIRIGANYTTGADFFPGAIDDVRIYDIGLTDAEIWDLYSRGKESYNSSTGLELWLKLNGDATDSSGNGYDGSVSGATSITNFYELPALGEITTDEVDTITFDGTNDFVTIPAGAISAGVNGASQVTFGGWVNSDAFPTASAKTILRAEIQTSAAAGLYLSYTSSTITYGGRSQGADAFQSTTYSYTRSRVWDHVIVVMDIANDTLKLYLNGALVKTTTGLSFGASTYTDANNQSVVDTIGAGGTAGNADYWNGDMANIAIWKDERTAAEILADFQNGYVDTSDANLVAYYPFNEGTGTTADNAQGTAGLDGTLSGATWTKDATRPIPAVGTQITIDISGLGYTSTFYAREYMHTYQGTPDRTYAFTEITVEYTPTAQQVVGGARSYAYIF